MLSNNSIVSETDFDVSRLAASRVHAIQPAEIATVHTATSRSANHGTPSLCIAESNIQACIA